MLLRVFLSIVSLIFFVLFFPGATFAFSGSGAGTPGDPYIITTCVQLQEMDDARSAHYKLGNDINCSATSTWNSGNGFIPIGASYAAPFTGSFDGAGHTISKLFMNRTGYFFAGLFGLTQADISNVALVEVDLRSDQTAGGLVAYLNSGSVSNASVDGTVRVVGDYYSDIHAGGLIGYTDGGIVRNTYSTAMVTASTKHQQSVIIYVGGLIGYNQIAVENSYASGNADADGWDDPFLGDYGFAGGLIGYNSGTVSNSFAAGNATWTGLDGVSGGFIGQQDGTVINSFSVGSPAVGFGSSTGVTGGQSINDFYESSPLLAVYSGSTAWNFVDIWTFINDNSLPLLSQFIDPTPSPTPSSGGGGSSSSSGSDSSPTVTCAIMPIGSPDLFQINTTRNSATVYFSPVVNAQNYLISYGFSSDANQFNVFTNQAESTGVLAYTVNDLPNNSNMYFKVFAQNNCGEGNWSNTMQITTINRTYYKNLVSQILSILPRQKTVLGVKTTENVLRTPIKCETYTVKKGDSLWSIASEKLGSGTSYSSIIKVNDLSSIKLNSGQKIKVGC